MLSTSLPGGCPPAPVVCGQPSRRSPKRTSAVDREPVARHPADRLDQHPPLLDLDPLVQRLDGVVVVAPAPPRWATIGPVSTPASTTKRVQPVTFTPYASASAGPVHPGERRRQRRVGVERAAAELGEEGRPASFMKPARPPGRARTPPRSRSARRPSRRGWRSRRTRCTKVGTPTRSARRQPLDVGPVGADGDDAGAVRRVAAARRAGPGGWCPSRRRGRRGASGARRESRRVSRRSVPRSRTRPGAPPVASGRSRAARPRDRRDRGPRRRAG